MILSFTFPPVIRQIRLMVYHRAVALANVSSQEQ